MTSKHQFVGQKVKLSDICSIVSGATPKTTVKDYWGGDIKWITPSELNDDSHVIYNTAKHLTEAGFASARLRMCPEGTVLLTTRAPIGKVAIAGEPMCCNQGFKNLVCSDAVNNEYLYRYLKNRSSELQVLGRGATFKELSKKEVAAYEINLPPLKRQLEAVEKLALVDKQVVIAKTQLDKLDSLVKSRFVEMFGNDKLFQARQMGQLFSGIVSGTNVSGKQRSILPGEFAVLKISAVTKGFFKPNEYKVVDDVSNIKMIHPRKGDLLFSRANTSEMVGATAIVDDDYEQLFLPDKLWRLDPAEGVNSLFLKYLLSTERVRAEISKASTGTSGSMQNISMAKFSRIDVFLPSAELQQQFADFAAQVDKSRFAGTFTGTINVENYAISCSVHNNSGCIPNEALHSAREVTECALFELQELYDSLTQKYFAL